MSVLSHRMKPLFLLCTVLMCSTSAFGQKIDSYISDMREALVPYGTLTAPTCHAVEIDLKGPWSNFAIPDGTNKDSPGELTWTVLKVDVLRLYIDLSDLDEDKVQSQPIFSLDYISKHQKGAPYVADTPAVLLFTRGLNTHMTVHTVDLDKVHALRGQTHVTETQMGLSLDERKFAIITFSDQEHADVFQKAIKKAIVLCKAQ
jgi:hypothetical protein